MEQKGITMYRLAKDIHVHQTTVKNWLEGKGEPRVSELVKIADTLGASIFELMDIPPEETIQNFCSMLKKVGVKLQEGAQGDGSGGEQWEAIFTQLEKILEEDLSLARVRKMSGQYRAEAEAMLEASQQCRRRPEGEAGGRKAAPKADTLLSLMDGLNDTGWEKVIEYAEMLKCVPACRR